MIENKLVFLNKELQSITNRRLGISGENEQEVLEFSFSDTFVDGIAYLEIEFPISKRKIFIELTKDVNKYKIEVKNSLLVESGWLKMQLRIQTSSKVWKSYDWEMLVVEAINATQTIEDDYPDFVTRVDAEILEMKSSIQNNEDDINTNKEDIEENANNISELNENFILLKSKIGSKVLLNMNENFVMTLKLLDDENNELSAATIDFPIESMIVNASYANGKLKLILQNGNELEIDISAIISGLVNQDDFDETIENIETKINELDHRVDVLERTTLTVFEVEKKIIDSNGGIVTATTWTRRKDSIGMTAQATKDGSDVQNDFDNAPIYRDIISAEIDNSGNIVHYYGDNGYDPESGNDIFTIYPEHWQCRYQETRLDGIYEIRGVATQKADSHYYFCKEQKIARYEGTLVDNKLRSISGTIPLYNKNINQFRNYAKANSDTYGLEDVWARSILANLFLVEYANSNSQSVLGNGIMTFRDYTCALAETNTNRFLTSSNNTALPVGRTVCVGATGSWQNGVASDRTIESVEQVTIDGKTYTAYNLSGAAFNTTTSCHIWGSAQKTGWCDSLGMKSGCIINDGNHSVMYRGVENPFADMWEFIDGINLKAGNGTYICRDYTKYASDKYDNGYESIGYTKQTGDGWAKQMGYDENNPEIALPIAVGASDSSGYCDYYYNNNHTSNRVALLGGGFYNGSACGFFCWGFNHASGNASWHIGSRLLKHQ